jgi:hypothetical protein
MVRAPSLSRPAIRKPWPRHSADWNRTTSWHIGSLRRRSRRSAVIRGTSVPGGSPACSRRSSPFPAESLPMPLSGTSARCLVCYPTRPSVLGGTERLVASLTRELERHGIRVDTLTLPSPSGSKTQVLQEALAWTALDLSSTDADTWVLATKFPSYLLDHPQDRALPSVPRDLRPVRQPTELLRNEVLITISANHSCG